MTVRITADVFCDMCGCWEHGVTGGVYSSVAKPALAVVKKLGWSRQNNSMYLDLCPTCLEKSRRGDS